MTEFPFPTEGDSPLTADDGASGRRRPRLVALAAIAVLALGSGGFALSSGLLTGGSDDPTAASAPKPRPVATRPARPVTPATPPAVRLPVVYPEPVGRDPFKALYVVPVVAVVAPGATTGPTGATDPLASPSPTYPLKLTSVTVGTGSAATTLDVVVSGMRKTVLLGQRFGTHGELVVLSVNKSAAGVVTGVTLQVGDDQPVPLKVGETISVL